MNLTRRTNGIWMLSYRENGARKRVSTGERERADAERVATSILAGTHERAGAWTLEDALLDCYERVWSTSKSAEHTHRRLMKLNRLKGTTLLGLVSYDWLVGLSKELAEAGTGPATTNRYMALISKALGEAELRGKLARRPRIPYQREPQEKLRWITRAEEDQLLAGCPQLWTESDSNAMRCLLGFLLDTGARLSEALKAAPMAAGQVSFMDTKNGRNRTVPLTKRAEAGLMGMPSWWSVKACVERFSRLRDHCGLLDVTLHTMRHTCASRLVQGGMDLYRVQRWLGHSSITVTQRYAHLAPSSMDIGTEILERAPNGTNWR